MFLFHVSLARDFVNNLLFNLFSVVFFEDVLHNLPVILQNNRVYDVYGLVIDVPGHDCVF